MGTDIHMAVETYDGNGSWTLVWDSNSLYSRIIGGSEEDSDSFSNVELINCDWYFEHPFVLGRNYSLFYRLAGVRYGPVEPIKEPRGLPENAAIGTRKWYEDERECGGVHTPTYYYLSELEAVSWDHVEPDDDDGPYRPFERFAEKTIPALRDLGKPEDVRIIIFFDS